MANLDPPHGSVERWRERFENWATVTLIVGLSLGLWLAIMSPDPAAFLMSGQTWDWAVRLVTVIGVPVAAVIALRQLAVGLEQLRYIRKELAQRPELLVGFQSPESADEPVPITTLHVTPSWQDDGYSEPIQLVFSTYNAGTRTARDILWNYIFAAGCEPFSLGQALSDDDGVLAYRDEAGRIRFRERRTHINPGSGEKYSQVVRVPIGTKSFNVTALVSMADAPYQLVELQVVLDAVYPHRP